MLGDILTSIIAQASVRNHSFGRFVWFVWILPMSIVGGVVIGCLRSNPFSDDFNFYTECLPWMIGIPFAISFVWPGARR